jgi:hypothetical protein
MQDEAELDSDLDAMSRERLIAEARRLRAAIRLHRDSSGMALCWYHPSCGTCSPSAQGRRSRCPNGRNSYAAASAIGKAWTSRRRRLFGRQRNIRRGDSYLSVTNVSPFPYWLWSPLVDMVAAVADDPRTQFDKVRQLDRDEDEARFDERV